MIKPRKILFRHSIIDDWNLIRSRSRSGSFVIRHSLRTVLALALLTGGLSLSAQAELPSGTSTLGGTGPLKDEINADLQEHVNKGLKWLAQNQGEDGNFGDGGITGLAGLAFLASGSTPGEGPYGKNAARALDYVLKNCQESGMASQEMYGHGFATLFLAEAYGMAPRDDVKERLQKAVRLIEHAQNPQGGWRYQPVPIDADTSVTIAQVMALRAARNAGIKVQKLVIDKAIDYVKKAQEPDGGFRYTLDSAGSAFPRSAGGVAVLYYSGIYQGNEINAGIKYLQQHLPGKGENIATGHFFYGNYYGTQANFMAGGAAWKLWWPAVREALIKRQGTDGSWNGEASAQYATSMALIILQIPNRYLPILQK